MNFPRNVALAAAFLLLALAPAAFVPVASAQKGGTDVTPPARITILSIAEIGFTEATILATVTGDDGNANLATATEVRYRKTSECDYDAVSGTAKLPGTQTDCFNSSNWATLPGKSYSTPPAPGTKGVFTTDRFGAHPLVPGTSYLFALRMVDDKGNRSPVSPLLQETARSAGALTPWASGSSFVSNQLRTAARASLAYDATGQPVIAYSGADHVRITRSPDSGSTWTAPLLTETGADFGMNARLVPLHGTPSGAEFGLVYGGSTLKYRTLTGSSWGPAETIASGTRADGLVVAGSGPFLAYSPASTGTMNISFARRIEVNGSATWRLKAYTHAGLPSGTNVRNWDVAIALDPSDPTGNTIALAYGTQRTVTGGTSYALYYVTVTLQPPTSSTDAGVTWGTPVLLDQKDYAAATADAPAAPQTGRTPSIGFVKVDGTTNEWVTYISHLGGYRGLDKMILERRENGVWMETGEDMGYGRPEGMQTGVMVDQNGRVSVALRRANVGYVAHKVGNAWELRLLHEANTGAYDGYNVGPGGPAAAYYYRNPVSGVDELRYAVSAPLAAPAPAVALASTAAPTLGTEAGPLSLLPAYPNPFTGRTTLRFRLPEAGRAEVAIYDLLGREVARPLDGDVEAGTHTVTLDATGLVAGTYLVRLRSGGAMQTRTVTVTR